MVVAIAGGHGKIALRLTRLLTDEGHVVRSLIRNPDHAGDVRAAGGQSLLCDLEQVDVEGVAEAIEAVDAVVFAAGAGPGSGAERKQTMDHGGAVKLIAAAQQSGVDRYLMISSMGADPDATGEDTFTVYRRAKGLADAALTGSGLDYTIIRPTRLTDEPATGRVRIGEGLERGAISRGDVAAVLAVSLGAPATIGKAFDLTSGETPIDEALAAL
jgi:uncharacterized protein YbjT (DUF2867 family)